MPGDTPLDARHHLVLDADIGEGAAHHHLVMAAPGAIGVEVEFLDTAVVQIGTGGRRRLDVTGGRDVVGGDRVEEEAQNARALDILHCRWRHRQPVKIWWVRHIGAVAVPGIVHALGDLDLAPLGIALEHVLVALGESLAGDVLGDEIADLPGGRPDILQVDRPALFVVADGIGRKVDVERTGQRIGDNQRRRGQIIGAHIGVHAALEVAVAGEHSGSHQIIVPDRLRHILRQRSGIADTGGATIAHQIEADLVQVLLQARRCQVFGDDL